jgi:penicillin amidase
MGFFERPDPRETECADRDAAPAVFLMVRRHALGIACAAIVAGAYYAAGVFAGLRSSAITDGTVGGLPLTGQVTIRRDERDVPHVSARSERDAIFAEGFVEGSDRLFQMDLARRYALGELAEVLGAKVLPIDVEQRYAAIGPIADRQWQHLGPHDRSLLEAYSDGVNAAVSVQPLPVEFRLLAYHPRAWSPRDSLAVAAVATLELADSWHRIFARDAAWRRNSPRGFDAISPLSDPLYDVAMDDTQLPARGFSFTVMREMPTRTSVREAFRNEAVGEKLRAGPRPGSNVWAVGKSRTVNGRALLANDPHLDLTIPGIWYLVDVRFPGEHVAGAAIPGVPGVVLGHNDRIAWGASNAQTATASVYRAGALSRAAWVGERIRVRFAADVVRAYYRTPREFGVPNDNDRNQLALVRWPPYAQTQSTISTFLALDRAGGVGDALAVLRAYRGSPQNFVIADANGSVAYHLAGAIPDDPAWGRYVHPARDLRVSMQLVPFDALPAMAAAASHVVVSANNKMYGPTYGRRLSPSFEPPYRAYRIAQLLARRRTYDAAYFARMQMDTLSPVDLEIARAVVRIARANPLEVPGDSVDYLAAWDGRFAPDSKAASIEHAIRTAMLQSAPSFGALMARLREGAQSPDTFGAIRDALSPTLRREDAWGIAGAVPVEHPLAPMRFSFLNGPALEGLGDEYTIHLQEPGFTQGFRAVWDVGNWDAGGIAIPNGESGEPGSGHYHDLAGEWEKGTLHALPFSETAIARATRATLLLQP